MIWKEESQLLQSIKARQCFPVYLLHGEETYLRELYLKKLIRLTAGEEFREFNLHRFDGAQLDLDQLVLACESLPFFTQRRCVVVDRLDYEGMSASAREKLDALLADPVDTTSLLLSVEGQLQPKKSARAKKLLELCDRAGVVLSLGSRSASDLARFLRSRAESRGCSLSRELCNHLLQRCRGDMLTLSNELEKLTAYARSQAGELPGDALCPITREQIDAVTTKSVEASVYDLAKAILSGRYHRAMDTVADLLSLRVQPLAILAALEGAYLDLYVAKTAKHAGKGEAEIRERFGYRGREFVIRNSLRDCNRYSIQVLRRSLTQLAQADYRMKSSRTDDAVLLEQTVTQLFLLSEQ